LCHGVVVVFRNLGLGVNISATEVDVSWRIWNFLTRPAGLDEIADVLFHLTVFQSKPDLLA
jgi:hypothetical protein